MPWRDCAVLLEDLADRELQARYDSENLAMLVDREDYWLTFEYVNAITDPDDPETKRERILRKRQRIKPPPIPALRPVALRRPDIAEQVAELYARIKTGSTEPRDAQGKPVSKFDLIEGGW